jgi:parallel beta-helix repeat protein
MGRFRGLLIVACFLFFVCFCGPVSAMDVDGSVLNVSVNDTGSTNASLCQSDVNAGSVSLPDPQNLRTGKSYSSIQAAIDDPSTRDGDTIEVESGNYTENIILNKRLTLRPISGGNVVVCSLDSSIPVFTVTGDGSGSVIDGFTITGGYYGVYLDSVHDCIIYGDNIFNNNMAGVYLSSSFGDVVSENILDFDGCSGIYLLNSNNNTISWNNASESCYGTYLVNSSDNVLSQNTLSSIMEYCDSTGIHIESSQNNYISNNTLMDNNLGIIIEQDSQNNSVFSNIITNNGYGIYLIESLNSKIYDNEIYSNDRTIYNIDSSANICFNHILGTGICNECNGTTNAINNWWGANNLIYTNSTTGQSSYNIWNQNGIISYDPWLILRFDSTTLNNSTYTVTVDLTHNSQGNDTSPQGHIPDGIPVNFTTNMGTITNTAYMRNGKASATFNPGTASSGTATVTATLNNQSVQTNITISTDSTAPTVTASLAGGIYNTYQVITLSAIDNLDPNPVIYYTTDGSTPTILSTKYTSPLIILNPGTTTLKFMAVDNAGNQAAVQTQNYTLNLVSNINTGNHYSTIQAAIDDPLTLNGHIIEIPTGTFTENIIVNKTLTIRPALGSNVTINALDKSKPIFTISSSGNNTCIQGLNIENASNCGIYLDHSNSCNITGNTISNNYCGIHLQNSNNSLIYRNNILNNRDDGIYTHYSSNNVIKDNNLRNNNYGMYVYYQSNNNSFSGNNIINSTYLGIYLCFNSNSTIQNNNITNNKYGIYFWISNNITVINNIVTDNQYGIFSYNSLSNIFFNRITKNNIYGICNSGNGILSAENNWWGINNPIYINSTDQNSYCDIWNKRGILNYEPWLILTVKTVPCNISNGKYNTTLITADLSHNIHGADVSDKGTVPDGIQVNFTSDLGTINPITYTLNGKAESYLDLSNVLSGTVNVTVSIDKENVLTKVSTCPVTNINTSKIYCNIQDAIDDLLTLNGHIIEVASGTYSENVIVNKKVIIRPVTRNNVIINALSLFNPIFTITSSGSGSWIQGFTLVGPTSLDTARGIYLQSTTNCNIIGNIIKGNYCGINIYDSNNNLLLNNTIVDSKYAIILKDSSVNLIVENVISENYEGIHAYNSLNSTLYKNNITYNLYNGINFSGTNNIIFQNCISNNSGNGMIFSNSYNNTILENNISHNLENGISFYSSSGEVNFNRIVGNNLYGLITNDNCTVNATNNWWGTNNPTNLSTNGSDIYNNGGIVYHEAWLMLNLNGSVIHVTHNSTSDSEITVDLTHNNQGDNTSPYGTIPDGIPVNFTTTLGTINSTATTRKGKITVTLTSSPSSGATTVTATLDNQQVSKSFRKSFSTIQAAISNSLTVDGDVIVVENGTYTENIYVYKNLTLISEGNVTVQATNTSQPVFTITSGGNGSIITGFTVTGGCNGVYLNMTSNCNITGNLLTNDYCGIGLSSSCHNIISGNSFNKYKGINLTNSCNNTISENILTENNWGAINLLCSNCNEIFGNVINNNGDGIYLDNSINNTIFTNNISRIIEGCGITLYNHSMNNTIFNNTIGEGSNGIFIINSANDFISKNNIEEIYILNSNNITINGNNINNGAGISIGNSNNIIIHENSINADYFTSICLFNSSTDIQFNSIFGNVNYDLKNMGNGTTNAINNWWGTNTPVVVSSDTTADIIIKDGTVIYNPWLILNVTANPTTVTDNNSTVTADLTHNSQGNDTSPQGHIPDGIPVNFTTNMGTITNTAYMRNGKASATFSRGIVTDGVANVTSTLDRQSVQVNLPVQTGLTPLTVADLGGGVYNSDKNVTLTAYDIHDLHPVIFYSLNNGTTWNNQTNSATLSLYQGKWELSYYARDTAGYTSLVQNVTYVIDETAPAVWANLTTGLYNTSQVVNLTVTDNFDPNPLIYYTLNGRDPTTTSTIYTEPLNIINTTTLKFMAVDNAGNHGSITTEYYIFAPIGNINTGKGYSSIQAAINDASTLNGHVIEVSNGTYTENVVVNKNLTLISEGNVTVQATNTSQPVFTINNGGNGSWIRGFVISGSVNSYGLLLDGCSNCTINNNTITSNYFGILTNTVKTENNTIINNNITLNQEVGLGTWNADNYVIYGNIITYNPYGGITLFDSDNTVISTNLIMENCSSGNYDSSGILLSNSNNTLIQNNLIPENIYGVYIDHCGNCTINGNLITENLAGICTDYSQVNVNFNSITANSAYELMNEYGNINATNNWWGSNNPQINIYNSNGSVNTSSWLVLSIDSSSTVNSGGNASITADLTHNNLGQDTSTMGHVIDNLPVHFTTSVGTITGTVRTMGGRATDIINLGTLQPQTVNVSATLDNQTLSTQAVITPGSATLNITSTALDKSTDSQVNLTYTMPLNSSVTWLSVLWKNTYVFYGELQIIVNGTVVKTADYVNPAYNTWKNSYRGDVFRAIIYTNNYILQDKMDPNAVPTSFWNDLTSQYNLTTAELQFIQSHRLEFTDNLTVNINYPGVVAPVMTVTDPETSSINLNFPGNTIHRTSTLMYMDGLSAGYEGVKSFAIATTKVGDDILTYWLNQNSTYPVGARKAAYGTFLTALLVEYCHDQVADSAASQYKVTWSRTHPVVVSVGDDPYQTYITLECDHGMGMTVIGSFKDMWMFNYISSAALSPIEYAVMSEIGAETGTSTAVLPDLINAYLTNSTSVDCFMANGSIIESTNNNTELLILNTETGILRDINTITGY